MDKILKAEQAQRLLEDDFFVEIINELKNLQISAILSTNEFDIDVRENAYRTVKTLDLIVGHLQSIAAEKNIKEKRFKIL